MSFPFGGHPTLQEFITFATDHGCKIAYKIRTAESGKVFRVLEITSTAGPVVPVVEPDKLSFLSPSTVTNLQRRLGIKTPFAAKPEPSKEEDSPTKLD